MPIDTLSTAIWLGFAALVLGTLTGFALMESDFMNRARIILLSLRRRSRKRRHRGGRNAYSGDTFHAPETAYAGGDGYRVVPDPVGFNACRAFVDFIIEREEGHIDSVYLFGSRARGDFSADSDIDVAVLLAPGARPTVGIYWTLIRGAFSILIRQGAYLQPRLIAADVRHNSVYFPVLEREGCRLWPCADSAQVVAVPGRMAVALDREG